MAVVAGTRQSCALKMSALVFLPLVSCQTISKETIPMMLALPICNWED